MVQNTWGLLEILVQWCLCQADLSGGGHCNGERMALWKWGNKEFYTNLNGCHILQGTIYQLVIYTPEWVQFSNETRGSKMDIECKVVQDEKWNIKDWCGYQ